MSVTPGQPGSELIAERPDPPPAEGSVLVAGPLAGICGTDAEIAAGAGQFAPAGVMCLVGISSSPQHRAVDLNRTGASMVLANSVTFGTVSAARRHYELAVETLARAGQAWRGALISQRVPLSAWPHMLTRQPGDVKVVADLTR